MRSESLEAGKRGLDSVGLRGCSQCSTMTRIGEGGSWLIRLQRGRTIRRWTCDSCTTKRKARANAARD